MQEVPFAAGHGDVLQPPVEADAVIHVDHVTAGLQLGKRGHGAHPRNATVAAMLPLLPENFFVCDQHQAVGRHTEAVCEMSFYYLQLLAIAVERLSQGFKTGYPLNTFELKQVFYPAGLGVIAGRHDHAGARRAGRDQFPGDRRKPLPRTTGTHLRTRAGDDRVARAFQFPVAITR